MAKVCILKSEHPSIRRALDMLNFTVNECELVVIKPDTCSTSASREEAVDTNLIEQVLKIYEGKAKCAIAGRGRPDITADECFETSGVKELCERYDAYTVDLNKDVRIPVERDYMALKDFKMPTTILKADVFINMPKMRTNSVNTVSLSLMNMFDIIPRKELYYPKITNSICDLMSIRSPDMNIMDGVMCMEGKGMDRRPKRMDLILASKDAVALDTTACRIMGINPVNVEHIFRAGYFGVGENTEKNIRIIGRTVDDVRSRFDY